MNTGAFFDVDKTILAENSGSLYLKTLYERGEIEWRELLRNLGAYLQYKLNLLDLDRWTEQTMRMFGGRREEEFRLEAEAWFKEEVQPAIYPQAAELVAQHLAAGHVVALVSGSPRYVIEPLAHHLSVPNSLYTHLEVRDGVITGRVLKPICFGEGKIYWLQQLIEAREIDLAKSWFYTDSISDQPLLDLVGHPVAVNPDPLLYREALRRHWPVRLFEDPRRGQPRGAARADEEPGAR